MAAFGYAEEDAPVLTDDDRTAMASVDAQTDQLMGRAFAVLDGHAGTDLADAVRRMSAAAPACRDGAPPGVLTTGRIHASPLSGMALEGALVVPNGSGGTTRPSA